MAIISDVPSMGEWKDLTTVGQKRSSYSVESYFRESFYDLKNLCGDEAATTVQRNSFIIFKPDAIAGRRVERGLSLLATEGIKPTYAIRYQWTREACQEVWRYQWNIATLDRIAASTFINRLSNSLIVFVRDARPSPVPVSVKLNALKGVTPATPANGARLRYLMGAPARMLTMVHAPDEPVDVVRELGILFDRSRRIEIYENVFLKEESFSEQTLRDEISRLYETTEQTQFDVLDCWVEINRRVSDDVRLKISKLRKDLENGVRISWYELSEFLARHGASRWEIAIIAANYLEANLPDRSTLLENDGGLDWINKLAKSQVDELAWWHKSPGALEAASLSSAENTK